MSKKKPKKKPTRGSGVSVTLPTEPMAGEAKTAPVMAVLVQDDGVTLFDYEIKPGNSIQFRVGGKTKAFMERVGDAPDGDLFLDGDSSNIEPITVEFKHALSGPQKVQIGPGQRLTLNPVVSKEWVMSAKNWE